MKDVSTRIYLARSMATSGRRLARATFRTTLEIRAKADGSRVSSTDLKIEEFFRQEVTRHFPEDGILGEELTEKSGSSRFTWVFDPIDGTESFVHGVPLYGILIGLLENDVPILGIAEIPQLKERWYAKVGHHALLNGKRCFTKVPVDLSCITTFTTTPDAFTGPDRSALERLKVVSQRMRYGGDCYSYCMLASGFVHAVVEVNLQPFDFLPIVPIVEQAGGYMTDWSGNRLTPRSDGRVLATGSRALHELLCRTLNGG